MKIEDYVHGIDEALRGSQERLEEIIDILKITHRRNKRIWVLGNGGSLAIAQHFAQDMIKMCGVRAHAITCPSIITAYTNDHAFEYSSYRPVQVLRDPGDAVMIFSCSGKSRNYIEFVSMQDHPLIAVVGTDGGFLIEKADFSVHVKSHDYQVCETAFCVIADLIVKSMKEIQ